MAEHQTAGNSHCLNCGAALSGPYCSRCGQHDIEYHRSIGPMAEDALEGFFHFDGKFLKSMRYLFIRPGFLTTEFIAGRRARYTHPLRFYVFASFLFFAVAALTNIWPVTVTVTPDAPPAANATPPLAPAGPKPKGWFERVILNNTDTFAAGEAEALTREVQHLFPAMLFLCLPLFALVLKLVYRRGGKLYIEHLIFALHVQSFVFLMALAADLIQLPLRVFGPAAPKIAVFLLFDLGVWLVYRAFRTVYRQGRWWTWAKMIVAVLAYGAIAGLGTAAVLVASVYKVTHGR